MLYKSSQNHQYDYSVATKPLACQVKMLGSHEPLGTDFNLWGGCDSVTESIVSQPKGQEFDPKSCCPHAIVSKGRTFNPKLPLVAVPSVKKRD